MKIVVHQLLNGRPEKKEQTFQIGAQSSVHIPVARLAASRTIAGISTIMMRWPRRQIHFFGAWYSRRKYRTASQAVCKAKAGLRTRKRVMKPWGRNRKLQTSACETQAPLTEDTEDSPTHPVSPGLDVDVGVSSENEVHFGAGVTVQVGQDRRNPGIRWGSYNHGSGSVQE